MVLGFIYPGVEAYIDDYFHSLSLQNNKYFDVCIYNDGFNSDVLNTALKKYQNLNIAVKCLETKYSPAKIREKAIHEIADKYDYLIFTDMDDFFSSDRIEKSVLALQKRDFCYNEMILVDNIGVEMGIKSYFTYKDNPNEVIKYEQLLDKNFCGLSNTAINLKSVFLGDIKIPEELIAVDWWIFSILLIRGYHGSFIRDTYTYYRQHEMNTIGGMNKVDKQQLMKGIRLKKEHYRFLLEYCSSHYEGIIRKEYESINLLEEKLQNNRELDDFLININKENKEFLWWEYIKLNER